MNINPGRAFGTAEITFGEDERGYLVCHAKGSAGEIWAASRSWNVVEFAGLWATFGEGSDEKRMGYGKSQEQAVSQYAAIEASEALHRMPPAVRAFDEADSNYMEIANLLDNVIPEMPVEYRTAAYLKAAHRAWELSQPRS